MGEVLQKKVINYIKKLSNQQPYKLLPTLCLQKNNYEKEH